MSAHAETIEFCHVHGYAHPDGELEQVDTIPPELVVDADEFGDPVVEPCHEETWNVIVLDPDEFQVTEETVLTQNSEGFFTLKAGDLAYIYTIRGSLVPCKVIHVDDQGETTVYVTANRLGWTKGARESFRNPQVSLVHRGMVSMRRGQVRVNGSLRMVTDKGQVIR